MKKSSSEPFYFPLGKRSFVSLCNKERSGLKFLLRIFTKNQEKERRFLVSMNNQKGSVLNLKKGGRCLEAPNKTCHAVSQAQKCSLQPSLKQNLRIRGKLCINQKCTQWRPCVPPGLEEHSTLSANVWDEQELQDLFRAHLPRNGKCRY